jgi:ribosomal protein RSM22 (predicted rRNA methylase)
LRAGAAAISARYRAGGVSDDLDMAAYLTVRLPATYAVNRRILTELATRLPAFTPTSMADIGAGPGTSSWAALQAFPSLDAVTQIEASWRFAKVLRRLNVTSGFDALRFAKVVESTAAQWIPDSRHDLVIASYVLAEQPLAAAATAALSAWNATGEVLLLIEPGTPDGHARLMAARKALLSAGAQMLGPCTHAAPCPLQAGDWCHFKTRVQRSRAHMHAKGGIVPFEDEAYSWLAVSRHPRPLPPGRIVAPVHQNKVGIDLKVCAEGEVRPLHVASRDSANYKRHRKLAWGDTLPEERT